jgi:integrase
MGRAEVLQGVRQMRFEGLLERHERGEQARQAIAALRQGVDVNLEKRRERDTASRRQQQTKRVQLATGYAADTFGAIATRYIERECVRLARGAEIEPTIQRELLPALGTRPFATLRRHDLRNVVTAIIARGRPAAAHKVREIGKRIASRAADDEELIDQNPFLGGKSPVRMVSRDRVLSTGEITALWRASETIGRPFGAMIMRLLATLQRRDEVSAMKNAELDLERRLWTIPGARAKNRKEHLVPLSSLAVEILAAVPIIDERYVFSTRPATRVSGFSKAKRRVDELSGVADWRLHDLRRTATTGMAELRVDRRVISKLLNHTPRGVIGVTAISDRYEYLEERGEAMERWAQRPRYREPAAGRFRQTARGVVSYVQVAKAGVPPFCCSTAPALTTILNCVRTRSSLYLQQVYSKSSPFGCVDQGEAWVALAPDL